VLGVAGLLFLAVKSGLLFSCMSSLMGCCSGGGNNSTSSRPATGSRSSNLSGGSKAGVEAGGRGSRAGAGYGRQGQAGAGADVLPGPYYWQQQLQLQQQKQLQLLHQQQRQEQLLQQRSEQQPRSQQWRAPQPDSSSYPQDQPGLRGGSPSQQHAAAVSPDSTSLWRAAAAASRQAETVDRLSLRRPSPRMSAGVSDCGAPLLASSDVSSEGGGLGSSSGALPLNLLPPRASRVDRMR
jgi:hypothetical protein